MICRSVNGDQGRGAGRGGGCILAVAAAAGAFVSFGLMPLVAASPAKADIEDVVTDPIINSITGALTSLTDAFAGLDPATDLSALDLGSVGLDTSAVSAAAVDLAGGGAASGGTDSATTTAAATLDSVLHTLEQEWITSATGVNFDDNLNTLWTDFGGSGMLIGNGANGVDGATLAEATGGNGGLWFGDGGNGATDAAGVGGDGGSAGLFGDGGDGGAGGDGAAGAVGGNGGDGGAGGTWIGDGGNGGNAGDAGAGATGLAALGGAGGQGGVDGTHGAVGDYGTGTIASPTGTLSQISADGDYLTTSDGQVIDLHGVNVVDKEAPYEPASIGFSDQDAAFLQENGINVVRLGVLWAGVEPEPGVYDTSYLDSIQSTVQTLAHHGIYTILDFHQDGFSAATGGDGAPAWATETGGLPNPQLGFPLTEFLNPAESHAWGEFWTNADASNGVGLEDNYSQMVEHVANYFSGNSDVAGIEIMNEPYNQGTLVGLFGGNTAFNSQELTPFYEQAASAIRAVDPNMPILYEPNAEYNFDPSTAGLGSLDQPGTVFAFHNYCEVILGSSGCFPDVATAANNAAAYGQANGIPVLMTEFGASSNQAQLEASMQAADQNSIGWTEWAFTGQGDATATGSSVNDEALVYNPELPPTGDNVNTATLQTLAEPYAQTISGTPESSAFTNGVFQFSYSTQETDGLGSFPAGSQTIVSVPTVEFPHGYIVAVTGGEVVSAPNATELIIESDSGASTITITVSPATGS